MWVLVAIGVCNVVLRAVMVKACVGDLYSCRFKLYSSLKYDFLVAMVRS